MISSEILIKEHDVILKRIVNIRTTLNGTLGNGIDQFEAFIQFCQIYADDFHHAKEEDIYFAWMRGKNPQLDNGPLMCMLSDHERGRFLIKFAIEAIQKYKETQDGSYLMNMKKAFLEFATLLENHISKENDVLYKLADEMDQTFQDGDKFMLSQFEKVREKFSSVVAQFE